ncbi:DUF459 domain-containing protein [Methylocystis sp. WRRC1]|uniref:SGNH/GDSL hydrolase family protein n=1 Tax=Methylocystis sp. WRRC1 TaxID=1732014 RepID=UPI001D1454C1|nr:SGNH family hydrolase [Methylocystis sp. WRRC1]MCC3244088.1 DUF459 domain-containing protein [Methylocystis sp. WRRC1]
MHEATIGPYIPFMSAERTRKSFSPRRALAAFLLVMAALVMSAPESFAQDPFSDFFGGLFGGGGGGQRSAPSRPPSQPRVRRMMPHQENRAPTYWRGGEARAPRRAAKRTEGSAATPGAEQTTTAPAVPPSYFVAVMGDTLGILLSNGLQEAFSDKPDIAVLRKGKESSGLVRDDFYDWPKAARELAGGSQKIDVAVMMIGSNDRQTLRQGADALDPLSPKWREIYAARVDAIIAAFKEKKIPVVWVGLPVMKNESYSADMAKLNEIFRDRASANGAVFVDLWEALADERGQYSAFGPDINGQIVKLRSGDGVHFTEAGARSVAHFVASEVKKLYDARKPAEPAPASGQPTATAPAGQDGQPASQTAGHGAPNGAPVVFRSPVEAPVSSAPTLPDRPAIGPTQPLNAVPATAGGELARRTQAAPAADAGAQALTRHVFVEGGDQAPRPNRADDYSWKP